MAIQTYFDGVYAQVGNLDVVPAPRSGKWDARVVEEHTEEGQVRFSLADNHDAFLNPLC